jgi:hypothetical protein
MFDECCLKVWQFRGLFTAGAVSLFKGNMVLLRERRLSNEERNRVDKTVDRLMNREFVRKFPPSEAIDEILFNEGFISAVENPAVIAVVERDESGKIVEIDYSNDLQETVSRRIRYNLQPSVAKWR